MWIVCDLVAREVTAYPILARAISNGGDDKSLLVEVFGHYGREWDTNLALKMLIEANPHALVWEYKHHRHHGFSSTSINIPMGDIANNERHCPLMPWIAQHFAFMLDRCQQDPPHLGLAEMSSFGERLLCVSEVRDFYKFYPQGLLQKNSDGLTVLHDACTSLCAFPDNEDDMADLICHLASECPEAVRIVARHYGLPIEQLMEHTHRAAVQKVLLCLLRAYPESADTIMGTLRTGPFIRHIVPLVEEEVSLREEMVALVKTCDAWGEATARRTTNTHLHTAASDVFSNWSMLRVARIQKVLQEILPERIEEVCLAFEADNGVLDEDMDE